MEQDVRTSDYLYELLLSRNMKLLSEEEIVQFYLDRVQRRYCVISFFTLKPREKVYKEVKRSATECYLRALGKLVQEGKIGAAVKDSKRACSAKGCGRSVDITYRVVCDKEDIRHESLCYKCAATAKRVIGSRKAHIEQED